MPIPLSMSRNHARPSSLAFLSVISLSGLKCCSSKVRPFSNQLSPSVASDIARASLTLPALVWLSAEEQTAMVNASARHRAVRPRTCHFLIRDLFWSHQDARGHHSMPVQASRIKWDLPRTRRDSCPQLSCRAELDPVFSAESTSGSGAPPGNEDICPYVVGARSIMKGCFLIAAGSVRSSAAAIEACKECRRRVPCRETWPGLRVWRRPPVLRLLPRSSRGPG